MIGKLTGTIDSIGGGKIILDVQGVGYVVQASSRTLSRIGRAGDRASLLIDTHVREDAISLYGFADADEQRWFRLLTGVQGVGAKAAFAILSVCAPDQIALAIAAQDKAALTRADGVGPKLAARILTELKDKAANIDVPAVAATLPASGKKAADATDDINNDAVSALVNLGYARSDAFTAVARARGKANDNEREKLDAIIRLALKELSG